MHSGMNLRFAASPHIKRYRPMYNNLRCCTSCCMVGNLQIQIKSINISIEWKSTIPFFHNCPLPPPPCFFASHNKGTKKVQCMMYLHCLFPCQ